MSPTARGTFDVRLTPGATELDGAVSRFDLAKQFQGDLEATAAGVMLSSGDPARGSAGYVAIEAVRGRLDGHAGGFVLQQLGTMHASSQELRYEVVPGSGDGELEGLTGAVSLVIEGDGTHRYELVYDLER